jgi:hypothetical protein
VGNGVRRRVLCPLGLAIALGACAPLVPAPPPSPAWPALTLGQLRNAAYRTEFSGGGPVRLLDGVYREAAAPGSSTGLFVALADQAAFGDLDRDGSPDAAVVLAVNPGGSGTFHYLAAVFNRRGTPEFQDSALLGDRVKLRGVWISGGLITVEMTAHGPDDPYCCPSQEITRVYRLRGNTLTRAD